MPWWCSREPMGSQRELRLRSVGAQHDGNGRKIANGAEQCACANGLALVASLGFVICLTVTLAVAISAIAPVSDRTLAVRRNVSAACPDCRSELERIQLQRGALLAHCSAGTLEAI